MKFMIFWFICTFFSFTCGYSYSNPISQAVSDYVITICSSDHPDYISGVSTIVCDLKAQDFELVNLNALVKGSFYLWDQKVIRNILEIIAEELIKIGGSDADQNPITKSEIIQNIAFHTRTSFFYMENYEIYFKLVDIFSKSPKFDLFARGCTTSLFIYGARFRPNLLKGYNCCNIPNMFGTDVFKATFYDSVKL